MNGDNILFATSPNFPVGAEWSNTHRFYARFSQAELMAGENTEVTAGALFFEACDANWFDQFTGDLRPEARNQFYAGARLALLEMRVPLTDMEAFGTYMERDDQPDPPWVEIYSGSAGYGPPLYLYANLFQEAANRFLDKIDLLDNRRARRLDQTVSLNHLPDATEAELKAALDPVGNASIPYAIAYDVGQGNATGLCGDDDVVLAYFDLGGGAGAHASTFPKALKFFCFTKDPVIILSHWDHDHWSSAHRAPAAFGRTWIAPRQTIGVIQAAVVTKIVSAGRLLLAGASFRSKRYGRLWLERCTGSGRNNGGLALTLNEKTDGKGPEMLFPADAQYRYVSSCASGKSYHSLIAPHHGAAPHASSVPGPLAYPTSRLVYSYGAGNSYGHATSAARSTHQSAGWIDPKVAPAAPTGVVRNTEDRNSTGLGHVLLSWNPHVTPPPLPCGGTGCQLQAVQL